MISTNTSKIHDKFEFVNSKFESDEKVVNLTSHQGHVHEYVGIKQIGLKNNYVNTPDQTKMYYGTGIGDYIVLKEGHYDVDRINKLLREENFKKIIVRSAEGSLTYNMVNFNSSA